MKQILCFLLYCQVFTAVAQIPVTDAATNGSLGLVNSQLIQTNIQLKAVNRNLLRLIQLLEKNNKETAKSKDILFEELEAKKKAPAYVWQSPDVGVTLSLKTKILKAYRQARETLQNFKYLDQQERQEFTLFAADVLLDTKNLFAQCQDILKTRDLIQPEERLKKINGINRDLEQLLEQLLAYSEKLNQLNGFRKAKHSLIDINRN